MTKQEIENIRAKMQDELDSLKEATEMWRAEAPGRDLLHPSHPELTAYLLKQLKIADSNAEYDRLCEEFEEL
jgi:hypothetical protein